MCPWYVQHSKNNADVVKKATYTRDKTILPDKNRAFYYSGFMQKITLFNLEVMGWFRFIISFSYN